jgi:type IV pilus assembly protein PilF
MNAQTRLNSVTRGHLMSSNLRFLILMTLSIFISGCASYQAEQSDKENKSRKAAESNTSLGLEYMNRGQYEVALGKLKKAVKEDPGYAPAYTVMAVLYDRIGEKELAGKQYRKAYEADPTNGDVNNNYGVFLCQTSDARKAIGHFQTALEDPFYSSPSIALANAGSCELGRGNLVEAEGFLRRALTLEPDLPDALMSMTQLNFEKENYLGARAFMQRYEAVASPGAAGLLLGYKVEKASGDEKSAYKYRIALENRFPKSEQAAELRMVSDR